jgi:hypothetical protein
MTSAIIFGSAVMMERINVMMPIQNPFSERRAARPTTMASQNMTASRAPIA